MTVRAIHIEGVADPATLALIRAALESAPASVSVLALAGPRRKPSFGALLRKASLETGIATEVIVGPSRRRGAVRARTAVIWAADAHLGLSRQAIGDLLGERDHSTICAALRRAFDWIQTDAAFRALTILMGQFMEGGTA